MSQEPAELPDALSRDEQARLLDALPWYLNGTLPAAEQAWVDALAERSAQARRLIVDERRLAFCLQAAVATVPVDVGGERLRQRLAQAATGRAPGAQLTTSGGWRTLAWSGMLLVLLVQGAAIVHFREAAQPGFSATRSLDATARPDLRVRFQSGTAFGQIEASLQASGAEIVAGPDATGTVWLRSRLFSTAELKQRMQASGVLAAAIEDPQGPP